MIRRRRTRIVATLGPASHAPEMIRTLAEAGVDVFRLNFSHGTHDEHAAALKGVRAAGSRSSLGFGCASTSTRSRATRAASSCPTPKC